MKDWKKKKDFGNYRLANLMWIPDSNQEQMPRKKKKKNWTDDDSQEEWMIEKKPENRLK